MLKEITSLQHPAIKHLVRLRQNRDYRYEHHSLVIEGIKTITEVGKDVHIKLLLATDESLIPRGLKAAEILIVSEEVLHKASGMQNPEGLIAEVEMPKNSSLKGLKYVIAVDGVNDPGNLGTLLRTALALGWEGVFIVNESCDPYNEKALRAGRGATFRLPIAMGNWADLKKLADENKLTIAVADLHGNSPETLKKEKGLLLVLGNEAQGPSKEALTGSHKITIDMPGPMESLNVAVAGGILMYCLKQP